MKIEAYHYPQADYLAKAVGEAMALFAVPVHDTSGRAIGVDGEISAGVMVVHNQVQFDPLRVVTRIEYRQTGEGLVQREEASPSASADEDPRAAARRLVQLNLLALLKGLTGRNPGPWGILRGVRPTKLAHRFFDQGLDSGDVSCRMQEYYAIEPDKARLVSGIALRQRPFLLSPAQAKNTVSVYIGIPFCPSRCLYCSFPGYVLPSERAAVDAFLAALERDIMAAAEDIERYGLAVQTVYVGGGTPTSLSADDFKRLLGIIRQKFVKANTLEFTVEAGRPDSVDDAKIAAMRDTGVTRVSVNPQTMQEKTLKLIGRRHTVHDIILILEKIRHAGIPVVNMDIIVGLPGEDRDQLADTMAGIAALAPENLTVHTLSLKKGSLLKSGQDGLGLPGEGVAAGMLALADGCAREMGMVPYYLYRQKYMADNLENIGYALPGRECVYNIQIIEERQTIIGIGPAASTKAVDPADWRLESTYMPKDLTTYQSQLDKFLDRRRRLLADLFES